MVLVEVIRKAYLASIVPVIVNAVLDSHQLIVDIVAFVSRGDFPRSRLGEKQRGKILGAWVTRKMRSIAQFSIRDDDGTDSQITEVAEPRSGVGSVVGVASSLSHVETVTSPPAAEHAESADYTTLPTGISEMPATYESSIIESPPLGSAEEDRDDTPTDPRGFHRDDFPSSNHGDHTSVDDYEDLRNDPYLHEHSDLPPEQQRHLRLTNETEDYPEYLTYATGVAHNGEDTNITPQNLTDASTFNFNPDPPPPAARYDNKPVLSQSHHHLNESSHSQSSHRDSALASLPSQQRYSSANYASHYNNNNNHHLGSGAASGKHPDASGGLRIANNNNDDDDDDGSDADDWRKEALLSMDLARDGSKPGSREGTAGDRGGFVVTGGGGGRGVGGGYDDNEAYGRGGGNFGHAM